MRKFAINRVHTGWQQQSLMHINEHIYIYNNILS